MTITLTHHRAMVEISSGLMATQLQAARDNARFEEAERQERYRAAVRAECALALVALREAIARFESAIAGIDERWIKPVAPDPAVGATPCNVVQHDETSPGGDVL